MNIFLDNNEHYALWNGGHSASYRLCLLLSWYPSILSEQGGGAIQAKALDAFHHHVDSR
jgi:hypothetical protein